MKKQELIKEISEDLSIPRTTVKKTLEAALDEIKLILEEGESYSQTGFGSFKTDIRHERIIYNPGIGKKMRLPLKRKVIFKASSILKGKLNE